jgi:hypothetical protein
MIDHAERTMTRAMRLLFALAAAVLLSRADPAWAQSGPPASAYAPGERPGKRFDGTFCIERYSSILGRWECRGDADLDEQKVLAARAASGGASATAPAAVRTASAKPTGGRFAYWCVPSGNGTTDWKGNRQGPAAVKLTIDLTRQEVALSSVHFLLDDSGTPFDWANVPTRFKDGRDYQPSLNVTPQQPGESAQDVARRSFASALAFGDEYGDAGRVQFVEDNGRGDSGAAVNFGEKVVRKGVVTTVYEATFDKGSMKIVQGSTDRAYCATTAAEARQRAEAGQ